MWSATPDNGNYLEDLILYRKMKGDRRVTGKPKIGERIHLYSRGGQYKVVSITGETMRITCTKWIKDVDYGLRLVSYEDVMVAEFKCYVGLPYSAKKDKV